MLSKSNREFNIHVPIDVGFTQYITIYYKCCYYIKGSSSLLL